MSVVILMLYQIPQRFHLLPTLVAGFFSGGVWPIDSHIDAITLLNFKIVFKNATHSFASSVPSHPFRKDTTLFLNHSKMLNVLTRFIEKFTSVHFNENTNHAPNIGKFVPFTTFKNNFGCSILSSVYYGLLLLIFISSTTKINYLNSVIQWSNPYLLSKSSAPASHSFCRVLGHVS